MRATFTLFLLAATCALASAQVPQSLSYQAVARDANGECLADQQISLQISILKNAIDGPVLYRERFEGSVQTNAVGHFEVKIGTGTPQTGAEHLNFSDIRWTNLRSFLKVEYAPGSTTAFQEVGTTELLTVPYAMAAGNGKTFGEINQDEFIVFLGTNKNRNVTIGGTGSDNQYNDGVIRLADAEGAARAIVASAPTDDGSYGNILTSGPNGSRNILLAVESQDRNHGLMRIYDGGGNTRVLMLSANSWDGAGTVRTYGPAGSENARLGIRSLDCKDNGLVYVYNSAGSARAGIRVDCNGSGYVFADGANGGVKSFRMPHPNKPDKQIVYASLEGPEAGAYERGTVTLVNGVAEVAFSETFGIVANPETLTVMALPWSADSKGLAVIERTAQGFKIKELGGGTGNYKVDWEAKAVRKGWEDFEVVQDVEKEELDQALHDDHH
jgi:hypothetical protein